jgi:low affinity Fe/Cu permease
LWAGTGAHFHYSDTWQLVVNTATTIVTFLMVFLIQNTHNRDARAIHLKLDEIIRAIRPANNNMINIEKLSDEELTDSCSPRRPDTPPTFSLNDWLTTRKRGHAPPFSVVD